MKLSSMPPKLASHFIITVIMVFALALNFFLFLKKLLIFMLCIIVLIVTLQGRGQKFFEWGIFKFFVWKNLEQKIFWIFFVKNPRKLKKIFRQGGICPPFPPWLRACNVDRNFDNFVIYLFFRKLTKVNTLKSQLCGSLALLVKFSYDVAFNSVSKI